ncbi:MAG: hemolysin family protein [Proteobacteria bacterium]|nr:hemolysin family protein [Pseudomonadota bacterium]
MKKRKLNFLFNLFGRKTKKSFSSVMLHLLDTYENAGLLRHEEKKMFKNIIAFGDKKVSNVMAQRADVISVNQTASLEEINKIITISGHSRIPVFKHDFDNIIGFIHSKDLSKFSREEDFVLTSILRKILFVPGSMKLLDVMFRMRMARVQIAVVLDEFGGVDGIVTIGNLMEEIVGEIEDEHDLPTEGMLFRIKKIDENKFQFGGRVEIEKMEEVLQRKVRNNNESFQTVGGFVLNLFDQVPEFDQEGEFDGLKVKILDADEKVVKLVEISDQSRSE